MYREGIDRMTDSTPIRATINPTPVNNPPRSLRAAVAERSDFPDVMIHEWTVLKLCSGDASLEADEIKYLVDEFFSPPLTMLDLRSEKHTSELQSLMRISYAVFCLNKNNTKITYHTN